MTKTEEPSKTSNSSANITTTASSMSSVAQIKLPDNINANPPAIFDASGSWKLWKAKWQLYLELRGITDEKPQRSLLLSLISEKILDDVFGEFGDSQIFQTPLKSIIDYLDKIYDTSKNITSNRHDFHQMTEKDEGPLKFLRDLKNKALACEFRQITDVADYSITMVFVTGIKDPNLRYLLLKEPKLDAVKVEEITRQYISTTEAMGNIGKNKGTKTTGGEIHQNFVKKNLPSHHKGSHKTPVKNDFNNHYKKCTFCKRPGHTYKECWHAKNKQETNKFGANTRKSFNNKSSKPHRKPHRAHEVTGYDPEDDSYQIHQIRAGYRQGPRMVTVLINKKPIEMELDTGAEISIIGEKDYERLGRPKIIAQAEKIHSYGTVVPMIGKINTVCELDKSNAEITLSVAKGNNRISLLGRDLIDKLNMDMGPYYKRMVPKIIKPSESPEIAALEVKEKDPEIRKKLLKILKKYAKVFGPDKGHCKVAKAHIELIENAKPVFCKPRRIPPALKPAVDKCLDDLIAKKVYIPIKWSEWATPLVIVPKPGDKVRICGDFKVTVNHQIKVDQYPLPRPEDLFDAMNGGKKFSKLDLKDAYLQIPLDEQSKKVLVINTHRGLFECQDLAFGVASAPAIFQEIMEKLLAGIPGVIIYLDDITITAENDEEHLKRLEEVLKRLEEANIRVKPEKCEFMLTEVRFLGHIVDAEGVRPIPEKIDGITKMPAPKNLKELQAFIGMVGYYGKFIPCLSTMAQPLNELRQKEVQWTWGPRQEKAFTMIKEMLSKAETLAHYDPQQEVVLATDASDYGLGAVIYHRYQNGMEKVIAYASRVMTPTEQKYAQIEKEALGIVWGIEKFNHYIYGRKFILLTDHQPLLKIFGPKSDMPVVAARRLHRWAVKMSMYTYDIQYVRTTAFGHADGLSRLPNPCENPVKIMEIEERKVQQIHETSLERIAISIEELQKAILEDKILAKTLEFVKNGCWPVKNKDPEMEPYWQKRDELSIINDVLAWDNRAVVPDKLKDRILKQLHRTHAGAARMKALARQTVWFPGIDKSIEAVAAKCKNCNESGPEKETVPLHPWAVPDRAWQRIHIDYAGPFLQHMWLIIVDAKTKWPEVVKLNKATTTTTVKALKRIFAINGYAELIVSDNGTPFTSEEFREFLKEGAIRHTLAPPYHPRSNGLAERFVRTFKEAFEKMAPKPSELDEALNDFLLLYRATPHPATGKSPAEMMLGRQIRTPVNILWQNDTIKEIPETRETYRARMKRNFDKGTRERDFMVEDPVYTRNLREGPKWYPGKIVRKLGGTMYIVQTDRGAWSRHADQIKPRIPELTPPREEKQTNDVDEKIIRNSKLLVDTNKNAKVTNECVENKNDNANLDEEVIEQTNVQEQTGHCEPTKGTTNVQPGLIVGTVTPPVEGVMGNKKRVTINVPESPTTTKDRNQTPIHPSLRKKKKQNEESQNVELRRSKRLENTNKINYKD